MEALTLPPDIERFAAEAVADGRYPNLTALVQAAVELLWQAESRKADLIASLEAANAEGEQLGFSGIEDVERELDAIIGAATRART